MPADGKKGITVKVDAELHAQVRQYLEDHDMTMAEFVTVALTNELHPKYNMKEEKNMGNMRTLAFQVPEDLFQRIKDYLQRNNMTQKEFVIGLIETELERDLAECEGMTAKEQEETAAESDSEAVSEETEGFMEKQERETFENDYETDSEVDDSEAYDGEDDEEAEDEAEDEDEGMGLPMGM